MRQFAGTEELTAAEMLAAGIRSIPRPSVLAEPVEVRGKKAAKGLQHLGIATRGDLIGHLPHSHQDRSDVRTVASLGEGEEATVAVTMRSLTVRPMRNRRLKKVEAQGLRRDRSRWWPCGGTSRGWRASWARARRCCCTARARRATSSRSRSTS